MEVSYKGQKYKVRNYVECVDSDNNSEVKYYYLENGLILRKTTINEKSVSELLTLKQLLTIIGVGTVLVQNNHELEFGSSQVSLNFQFVNDC